METTPRVVSIPNASGPAHALQACTLACKKAFPNPARQRLTFACLFCLMFLGNVLSMATLASTAFCEHNPSRPPAFYFSQLTQAYFPSYLAKSYTLFSKENYSKALESIEQVQANVKRPTSPEKISLLAALCYQGKGDHVQAIDSFKKSIKLRGSSSDTYFFLALSQLALNDPTSASATLEDAIWFGKFSLIPAYEINLNLGLAYRLQGNTTKAIASLNSAIAQNPSLAPAKYELGQIQLAAGNRAASIQLMREANAAAPADPYIKTGLVSALLLKADRTLNRSDLSEAKRICNSVIKDKDTPAELLKDATPLYIRTLLANGEVTNADKALNEALRKEPSNETLLALKEQVELEKAEQSK